MDALPRRRAADDDAMLLEQPGWRQMFKAPFNPTLFMRSALSLFHHPNTTFQRSFEQSGVILCVSLMLSNSDLDRLTLRAQRDAADMLSERLSEALRNDDFCVRIERSRYAIVPGGSDVTPEAVRRFAQSLADRLIGPQTLSCGRVTPRLHIGWSQGAAPDFDATLKCAANMLYKSIRCGHGFLMGMTLHGAELRHDLGDTAQSPSCAARRALDFGGAEAHFQPIIELETGAVSSAEALMRLRNERGVLMAPADFLRQAERYGQLSELGRGMLFQAAKVCKAWRAENLPRLNHDFRIAVNVSPRQLEETDLIDDVRRACGETGVDASALTIELTETGCVADYPRADKIFGELRDMGAYIALDDFGVENSWYGHLKNLTNIDIVKLDKSCKHGACVNKRDQGLFEGLVRLVQSVQAKVVVEGVENMTEARYLRDIGVDYAQGRSFSMPRPPEDMLQWLRRAPRPSMDGPV